MKRFLSIAMALCIGLTMSLDANAKRFGGGKSAGSAPSHQTRQAAPAAAPALLRRFSRCLRPTISSCCPAPC
ncbi:hypothetical protein GHO45_18695, partial [Pseudomonas sp. FSL R10-0765]|nr:hypothetical protein [Pseudomonas sp. FSL R10-0765]